MNCGLWHSAQTKVLFSKAETGLIRKEEEKKPAGRGLFFFTNLTDKMYNLQSTKCSLIRTLQVHICMVLFLNCLCRHEKVVSKGYYLIG